MPGPSEINRYQYSTSEQRRFWDANYIFELFQSNPVTSAVGGGAASGTSVTANVMSLPYTQLEYVALGTQTLTAPVINADGLNLGSQDQTASDGIEICSGITARAMPSFVIGTDPAFFVRARFKIEDVSGAASLMLGFREAEAYQASSDDYTDLAAFNVEAGTINLDTIKANAATVTTDTTDDWADGAEHELAVFVDAEGNVTYKLDTQEPTVVAAYQFTSGLRVIPFVRFIQGSDIAGAVPLEVLECGTVA